MTGTKRSQSSLWDHGLACMGEIMEERQVHNESQHIQTSSWSDNLAHVFAPYYMVSLKGVAQLSLQPLRFPQLNRGHTLACIWPNLEIKIRRSRVF